MIYWSRSVRIRNGTGWSTPRHGWHGSGKRSSSTTPARSTRPFVTETVDQMVGRLRHEGMVALRTPPTPVLVRHRCGVRGQRPDARALEDPPGSVTARPTGSRSKNGWSTRSRRPFRTTLKPTRSPWSGVGSTRVRSCAGSRPPNVMTSSAMYGVFREDAAARREFFHLAHLNS